MTIEDNSILENLPFLIQSPSRKARKEVTCNLIDLLQHPDINQRIVKDICYSLTLTLHCYKDNFSQSLINKLIIALIENYSEITIKYFIEILKDVIQKQRKIVVTTNTCKTSLFALQWSCLLFSTSWEINKRAIQTCLPQLVTIQAVLLTLILSVGNKKLSTKAFKILKHSWNVSDEVEIFYLDALRIQEQDQNSVVLASVIADRLEETHREKIFQFYCEEFLTAFIKYFISSKYRPQSNLIIACFPLLNQLNYELFKDNLMPALQKAMLRNPEIILECVDLVISSISFDLNILAIQIGKSLIAYLPSKNEQVRNEAVNAFKTLATQIGESEIIDELLQKIFALLHGSDGKMMTVDHKLSILKAAGNLSYNSVTGANLQNLLRKIIEYFIKVLETEVHEKTLCYALEMCSLWISKFENDIPQNVIQSFKTGMESKNSTTNVQISYIKCLLACENPNSLNNCSILLNIFLKIVDKAISQPTSHSTLVEGFYASCILVKITKNQNNKDNIQNFWNALLDGEKSIFFSDKLLSFITDEDFIFILKLSKIILLEYRNKLTKISLICKAILHCIIYSSFKNRNQCMSILNNILKESQDVSLSKILLNELQGFLENGRSIKINNNKENGSESSYEISSTAVVQILTTLCSFSNVLSNDIELLLMEALYPTHHPIIYNISPNLWVKLIKKWNITPYDLTTKQITFLKNNIMKNYTSTLTNENIITTLVSINGKCCFPLILDYVITSLKDSRINDITKEDYEIFLTPDDEIYDKSVFNNETQNNAINIKRESKAYSYKEQLEEMQLRKELNEKKKKDGKIIPQYTAKQLELIKNQKVKESVIRIFVNNVNNLIINCVSLINSAKKGNPLETSLHFNEILPLILDNLISPLAAPHLTKLYFDLRKIVFNHQELSLLGETIAYITLRLLKPNCELDLNWQVENLEDAIVRIIIKIYNKTITNKEFFNTPTFCYVFFLFKLSMLSQYGKIHNDIIYYGLQCISEHTKLRENDDNNLKFIYQPTYLPITQMFQLLFKILNEFDGRIQSQAVACLLDVTSSATGEIGLARASTKDIDIFLDSLLSENTVTRDAALRGLILLSSILNDYKNDEKYNALIIKRIWITKFDINKENRILADDLFEKLKLKFNENLIENLLSDIEYPVDCIQLSASEALARSLEDNPNLIDLILSKLLDLYNQRLQMIPSQLDEFGREIEKPKDLWFPRRGVALALANLAPLLTSEMIGNLVKFFVLTSLSDRNEHVRKEMLNAALKIVDIHGKECVSTLWPIFDNFMEKSSKSAHFDAVKQAVVVLMGSLARHLEKDDNRIKPIVTRLIQALSTPSQTVQEAVANCLPPLIPFVKDDAPGFINKLLHLLLKGDKYGERKGAAYGLAGLVKGLGILALKQHDIMTKLTDAIQDKKNYKHREGALFAFEMLFHMLGKLFEPYIIHVLPHLLQCFGDSSQYVRTAADDTAKVIMSKLSGHGVKLVLPSLLEALEQDSWRTKTGSVELLGAMAYCAPKQLSSCLPSIVPKLIEVLSDSHTKVQEAGATALKVIGSVIRNPEIQAIVPVLLKALQDPSNKTSVCLQTLLDTQFVHFIDAPSLALIMPVVQRAFMDRSTETRKMAAQIIGNMYSLTDQKDLLPYLPTILPGLKTSLLDPVPEVRSVSARALGAMVRGMGESSFEDLLPWLMQTLTSESSSVDRSGAAQGLSEVVGGLGVEKLHKLMPEIIATAERTDIAPHVKDGYIMMFIYMPVVFTTDFTPYIGQIINPILKALADENEYVRDTALKAGQRIVTLYADSAILLLLPELEAGLFDENWRIRYSSVQLLGDLLYRISGVTGKMSTETASEDDNFGTEQSHQAIIKALGAERRNRVLAGLYMGRSDVALMVRQAALHVWKVVVTNTPRTLREILPTLFGLLLGCLASDSYDKRQVAARTLGDLVRKLGERVLPEIIPILEKGLKSDQSDQRQGVCIGLSEIMASTSREMVLTFVNSLVPTVRKALCDPLPEVRQAAAKTFDSLHSTVGARALDDILPNMLNQLNDNDPNVVECTLDGLRQVMAIKSRVVLPYLVPQLTSPPANTKALSILASVAGEALNKYLPKILPALQNTLATTRGTPEEAQQLEYCQAVILSVSDEVGIRTIIDTMLENTRNETAEQRRAAATLLCGFCANSRTQYTTHISQLLRGLIYLCTDNDRDVLQMSHEALNAVIKTLEAKQQATYVSDVRQAVRFAMSDLKGITNLLPGFCLPKGIAPILPIFREAILNGDSDEKEVAAQGLGEIIKVTTADALQPSVVAITGPLIRILGDRFSPNVKIAVLETLAILLSKVGTMLKQFLPQLQTTFIKALNDPNKIVRLKSSNALSHLIVIHQRADPVFIELHNTIKNTDDTSIRETTLHALRGIISAAGDKLSDTVKKQIHQNLIILLSYHDDSIRNCAAGCFGALTKYLSGDILDVTLNEHLLNDNNQTDWILRHGRSAALSVALKENPNIFWMEKIKLNLIKTLLNQLTADKVIITQTAVRSCGYLLKYLMLNKETAPTSLLVPFFKTMNNNNNEVKQLVARVCIYLAKNVPFKDMSTDILKLMLPMLVNGTKEKNSYVKANSEIALLAVLHLKDHETNEKECLNILEVGARESLSDVINKVLKKTMYQIEIKEEELDDTLLT